MEYLLCIENLLSMEYILPINIQWISIQPSTLWAALQCLLVRTELLEVKSGIPQPPGRGLVPVRGLLEWGCTAGGERRAGERSFICRSPSLPITCITAWTILPPPSVEKLPSRKPVPGAKKVGDRWVKSLLVWLVKVWTYPASPSPMFPQPYGWDLGLQHLWTICMPHLGLNTSCWLW